MTPEEKRAAVIAKIRAGRAAKGINPPEEAQAPATAKTEIDPETGDIVAVPEETPPEATPQPEEKPKRKRRTKAEMAAARAAEGNEEEPEEEPEEKPPEVAPPVKDTTAPTKVAPVTVEKTVEVPADAPTSNIHMELPATGNKPIMITLSIKIEQSNG